MRQKTKWHNFNVLMMMCTIVMEDHAAVYLFFIFPTSEIQLSHMGKNTKNSYLNLLKELVKIKREACQVFYSFFTKSFPSFISIACQSYLTLFVISF